MQDSISALSGGKGAMRVCVCVCVRVRACTAHQRKVHIDFTTKGNRREEENTFSES